MVEYWINKLQINDILLIDYMEMVNMLIRLKILMNKYFSYCQLVSVYKTYANTRVIDS